MAKPNDELPEQTSPAREQVPHALKSRLAKAGLVLTVERAWPFIVLAIVIAVLFLALAWLGAFVVLPSWGRIIGVFLFAFSTVLAVLMALREGRATFRDRVIRLDQDSGENHRPATAALDTLASVNTDALTQTLWRLHQQSASERVQGLHVHLPRSDLVKKDPYALRFTIPLLGFAAFFIAGTERDARLYSAFDWRGSETDIVTTRLDAWIDPPCYTGSPPIIVDLKATADTKIKHFSVPVGSELVLRASDPSGITVDPSNGLVAKPERTSSAPSAGKEWRWILRETARLTVRSEGRALPELTFDPITDQAPHIALNTPPAVSDTGVSLSYRAGDDYGLVSGDVRIGNPRMGSRALLGHRPPLVAAPSIPLALPADPRDGDVTTKIEPSESPWAGSVIDLSLAVRDAAGQEAVTGPVSVRLPQRLFTNRLARALVEQRRILVLDPDRQQHVSNGLRALLIAPELFLPDPGAYIGLHDIELRLSKAKTDSELLDTATLMWQLALAIEDHEQGDEKKALDAAREALKKALENGASPDEIKALTDKLKTALDAYLKSLAAKARDKQQQTGENQKTPSKLIRPEDLQAMIDRMKDLAKRGAIEDANRMLEALNAIIDQLQMANPQLADPSMREMNEALDELDTLMRDQRALRDDTFRQGKGEPEAGSPKDSKALADRQGQLEGRLEAMRKRLKELGAEDQDGQGLGEAGDAMKNAEGALGEGDTQDALGAQGQAIEALRKGAQALAKSLDGNSQGKGQARNPGGQPESGQANGSPDDTDPLGRSTHRRDSGEAALQQGGKGGSLEKRSREVVEELRKRLGEPDRALDERNYLRRLLDRN